MSNERGVSEHPSQSKGGDASMTETIEELKPCPFCGGKAELDPMRGYRALSTGRIGNAVAIYCLSCSADMTMCHADHSGLTIEDMVYSLTEAWNRRTPPSSAGWQPISTAPKDGTQFWGKVDDDAIAMLWHPTFEAFVSSWRQMTMHNRWTFEDGSTTKDHSPVVHKPTAWMPLPPPSQEGASEGEGQT